MTKERIILISGSGKFPFLFAQAARKKGCYVLSIAIKHNTDPRLRRYVDDMRWFHISEFSKIFDFLEQESIDKVAMAGQIKPRTLFDKKIFQDETLRKFLIDLKDRRANSIFGAVARKLEEHGLSVLDSTLFLEDYLPAQSVLTGNEVSQGLWSDVRFGFQIAKEIGRLDIGQTVVVKDKAVVAVEALEGTDVTIRRAGMIVTRGCVVVKVAKPNQDKRFDIPVVGLRTIKNLVKIRARCLAVEARRTLIIDLQACITLAKKYQIDIVAV